jgi:hypothetical protein
LAPAEASARPDEEAAREAFVAALPIEDAVTANWDRLGWPIADS